MIRRLVLALSLTLYFASASCQSYTSGLQKTMTGADETAVIAGLHAVGPANIQHKQWRRLWNAATVN